MKNKEQELELIREWGHIAEINTNLLFNSYLFKEFKKLGRYCRKHQKLCIENCNVGVKEEELLRIETKINDFILGFNMWFLGNYKVKPLRIEFQRDPRGNTAKIYFVTDLQNKHFIIYEVLY